MKKLASFLTAILLSGLLANAQFNIDQITRFGNTADQVPAGMSISNGSLFIAGSDAGQSMIIKFETANILTSVWNLKWPNTATPVSELFGGVAADASGVYASGFSYDQTIDGSGGKEHKSIVCKFPTNGATGSGLGGIDWIAKPTFFAYKGYESMLGNLLHTEQDTSYLYSYGMAQTDGSNSTALLTKHYMNGTMKWQSIIGNPASGIQGYAYAMCLLNNYLYMGGCENHFNIWKVDLAGNKVWSKMTEATVPSVMNGICASDKHLYGAGYETITGKGNEALIIKYDENGTIVWKKVWGGSLDDMANGIAFIDNTLWVVGETSSYGSGGKDAFILKLNAADGSVIDSVFGGGTQDDAALKIVKDGPSIYISGTFQGTAQFGPNTLTSNGGKDLFLIKMNGMPTMHGNTVTADANTIILDHFDAASVGQIYGTQKYVQSVDGLSQAIELSKPGNYVKYSKNINLETKGTVEMWVNPSYYNKGLLNINWNNVTTSPSSGHVFHMSIDTLGKLSLSNWGYSISNMFHGNTRIPLNAWTHIAVTWGDSTKIYINGKLDLASSLLFRPAIRGQAYYYLPYWGDSTALFDEFHISNVVRSSAEIASRITSEQMEKVYTVSPGNLTNILTTNEKNTLTLLKLSGSIDARDFKTMRDMPLLETLDLSMVNIVSYSGTEGPRTVDTYYPENTIPRNAFYLATEKSKLTTVIQPSNLIGIGRSAYNLCSGLSNINWPSGLTTIGVAAFYNCRSLKSVEIPLGVAVIDSSTFRNCISLTSVSIPPSVHEIRNGAFLQCSELSSPFFLPGSQLTHIGDYAFGICPKVTSFNIPLTVNFIGNVAFLGTGVELNIPANHNYFATINGVLYDKALTRLKYCPSMKIGRIDIPNTVKSIAVDAFYNCMGLDSITMPSSLQVIEDWAFENCTGLKTMVIPASVNQIWSEAFYNCSGLKAIYVHSAAPVDLSRSDSVFNYINLSTCKLYVLKGLKTLFQTADKWKNFVNIVEVSDAMTVTPGNLSTLLPIEQRASMKRLNLAGNIDARDFKTMRDSMPMLEYIDLSGATVLAYTGTGGTVSATENYYPADKIPDGAFFRPNGNSTLNTVMLPNNLKIIGKASFTNCYRLNHLVIPSGVKKLDDFAFQHCNNLEQVILPASVDSIGYCTFTFNSAMKSFEVDGANPVFSSFEGVLFDKTRKTLVSYPNRKGNSYKVPEGVEVIDTAAFEGCWSLYNLELPTTLTRLCTEAFYECNNLVSIEIPASVNKIESYVFYNCKNLKLLYAKPTAPVDVSGSVSVFAGVDRTKCMLRVAIGSKSAYKVAARWSTFTWLAEDLYQQVTITAGGLATTLTYADLVTHLKISGTMDARDFKTMRDNMPLLIEADLSSASIVAYSGADGTLPYYNQYPANTTPSEAFYLREYGKSKSWFSKIALPASLLTIGDATFTNTGLRTISIHEGITQIQGWAFYGTQLNTITLPASLTSILDATFGSIRGLTSFTVASGNANFSTIDGCLYDKLGETLLYWPNAKSNQAIIPNGTKTIQKRAFEGCDFINFIYIPPTLSSINAPAFLWAGNLGKFEVESTNPWFSTMDGVLYDEMQKRLVAYPNQKGSYYDIPYGINEIGTYAFSGCWNLNALNIPTSVTKISNNAFNFCQNLSRIDLPTSINTIESEAFSECSGLKVVSANWMYPIDLSGSVHVFNNVNTSACVLKVPQGAASNYRSASQWNEFGFIDEVQNMTYRVQVPAGTKACYLAGEMNGWNQQPMTKESNNVYTISLFAHMSDQYKYCSGPDWSYEELDTAYNIINNRNFSPMDTVRTWRNVYQPWMPYTPWMLQSRSDYSIGKIQFVSATEGWIASGNSSGLLHTTDGGENWNKVTPFPNDLAGNFSDPAVSMDWVGTLHGWVLKTLKTDSVSDQSNGALMYSTTDGGSSWTRKAFPKSVETITYNDADFTGVWQIHEIMEGNYQYPQSFYSAWSSMKLTVGADGSCTFSDILMSSGTWIPSSDIEMYVQPNGVIKMKDSDFDGFLNADMKTGFFNTTNENGGHVFGFMQRQVLGTAYTTADLEGTWQMHMLNVDNPQSLGGNGSMWIYGDLTIDNAGNATINMVNSEGKISSSTSKLSISSDGFVYIEGMNWHGFMDVNKNSFSLTGTNTDPGQSLALNYVQKQKPGKTFSTTDLAGAWRYHELTAVDTDNPLTEGVLTYATANIQMDGNCKIQSQMRNGEKVEGIEVKLSISASGVITMDSADLHGFMNAEKTAFTFIRTDKHGNSFGVFQKDSTFSGDMGLQVQFADENNGWASTYNQLNAQFRFYRTTNGGNDWNEISNHGPAGFYDFVDANNGWAVTGYPSDTTTTPAWSIIHTTDGGLTWNNQFTMASNKDDSFNALQFTDLNHGWVTGNDGMIMKTVDGGQHWTQVTNTGRTPESNSKALFFLDANTGWISVDHNNGNELSILQTTDGGDHWSVQNTNLTDGSLFSLYFWDANHGWFTGEVYDENGVNGHYSGIIGCLNNGAIQIGKRASMEEVVLYPNPVKDGFHIRSIKAGSLVNIYDLNGVSVWKQKAEGDCYVDMKNLKMGMYVVNITTSTGVIRKKIVKM